MDHQERGDSHNISINNFLIAFYASGYSSMKKVLLSFLLYFMLLITVACVTTTVTEPFIYTNNQNTEFEILGTFEHRSSNRVGYIELFNTAQRLYPETDFVIDIMIDKHTITTSYHFIVFLIRQIFGTDIGKTQIIRFEYVMRGTAIRYIKSNSTPQLSVIPSTQTSTNNTNISPSGSISGDDFLVSRITGSVQWEFRGVFSDVQVGDRLTQNTIVRIGLNSSLGLTDGNTTITIPAGQIGRISELINRIGNN